MQCHLFEADDAQLTPAERAHLARFLTRLHIVVLDVKPPHRNVPHVHFAPYSTAVHYRPARLSREIQLVDTQSRRDRPLRELTGPQAQPEWRPERVAAHARPIRMAYVGMMSRGEAIRKDGWHVKRVVRPWPAAQNITSR